MSSFNERLNDLVNSFRAESHRAAEQAKHHATEIDDVDRYHVGAPEHVLEQRRIEAFHRAEDHLERGERARFRAAAAASGEFVCTHADLVDPLFTERHRDDIVAASAAGLLRIVPDEEVTDPYALEDDPE
jgi:hypothetical protein